jgi:hypothetical protein
MAKQKKSASAAVAVSRNTRVAVENLEQSGRKVQVVGRFVNGKLEIDHNSLKEMARKFPNANMSFVALNAPFDPVSQSAEELPA